MSGDTLNPGAFIVKSTRKPRKRSISLDIKSGRMNEYDPEYHDVLAAAFARRGMTPRQIADKLGVSTDRFSIWYEQSQSFRDAVDEGEEFCVAAAEGSLLKKALGYTVEEVVEITGFSQKKGDYEETRRSTRHVPPDTAAAKFYLQNKRPELWGEKEGSEGGIHIHWEEIRTEVVNSTDEIRQLMGKNEIIDAEIVEHADNSDTKTNRSN